MQLSEMRVLVQRAFASRADVTNAIVDAAINDVYKRLAMSFRFYELENTDTGITTADGTAAYSVPTGARKTISIVDTTNKNRLWPKDIEWYEQMDTSTDVSGRPEYYVRYGSQYLFWPTPDGAYAIRVRYTKLPTTLSADGDTPVYPTEWHMVIVRLAQADIAMDLGLDTRAMNLKNEGLSIITAIQEDRTMDERQQTAHVIVERTRPSSRQRGNYAEYPDG